MVPAIKRFTITDYKNIAALDSEPKDLNIYPNYDKPLGTNILEAVAVTLMNDEEFHDFVVLKAEDQLYEINGERLVRTRNDSNHILNNFEVAAELAFMPHGKAEFFKSSVQVENYPKKRFEMWRKDHAVALEKKDGSNFIFVFESADSSLITPRVISSKDISRNYDFNKSKNRGVPFIYDFKYGHDPLYSSQCLLRSRNRKWAIANINKVLKSSNTGLKLLNETDEENCFLVKYSEKFSGVKTEKIAPYTDFRFGGIIELIELLICVYTNTKGYLFLLDVDFIPVPANIKLIFKFVLENWCNTGRQVFMSLSNTTMNSKEISDLIKLISK